jgi:ribonuclease P protein component
MALNREQRIRGAAHVSRVFSGARPIHHGGLSVRTLRSEQGGTTFAVTVPVSVEQQAVKRNALRRRITECVRLLLARRKITDGVRVVITARRSALGVQEIRESLVLLMTKSGILQQ